jgi:hypothetical protein
VQSLKHKAVAAQGDNHLSIVEPNIAISLRQPASGFLGLGSITGDKG